MTRMPYLQEVRGKLRVRIPVPENLRPHLPQPHTGKKTLTKALGTGNEREANRLSIPHIAEFQGIIAKTEARVNGLSDLAALNDLPPFGPEMLQCAGPVFDRFLRSLNLPVPASQIENQPVTFDEMIALWGRGKPQQTIDGTTAKCHRFCEFLGHDDMLRVTFQNGRDWRDEMIEDGDLAPGSISNSLKLVKALYNFGLDNYPEKIATNPLARVKYSPGVGEARDDFTPDERRKILRMARDAEPHIKWLNWICSFHGPRNGEIADMSTHDMSVWRGFGYSISLQKIGPRVTGSRPLCHPAVWRSIKR